MNLVYVRIPVTYRVKQAEYAICIPMAWATRIREYLFNTYGGRVFSKMQLRGLAVAGILSMYIHT